MFGFFKSSERRRQEADLDVFAESLAEAMASAQAELHFLESRVEPRLRRQAAVVLVNCLVITERSAHALPRLQSSTERMLSEGRHHHAIGSSLATKLIACAIVLLTLKGEAWVKGALIFGCLEGLLVDFVQRHGVPAWPVHYASHDAFEAYRHKEIAETEAAELEARQA